MIVNGEQEHTPYNFSVSRKKILIHFGKYLHRIFISNMYNIFQVGKTGKYFVVKPTTKPTPKATTGGMK